MLSVLKLSLPTAQQAKAERPAEWGKFPFLAPSEDEKLELFAASRKVTASQSFHGVLPILCVYRNEVQTQLCQGYHIYSKRVFQTPKN